MGRYTIEPFVLALACLLSLFWGSAGVWAQTTPTDGASYHQNLVEVLLNDGSYKIRLQAAVLLGRSEYAGAADALIQALNTDTHETVRGSAATALGNLKDISAVAHVIRRAAIDSSRFVREEASSALRLFNRDKALPYVVASYGSENIRVREVVVTYLTEAPIQASQIVLLRAMGDQPSVVKIIKAYVSKLPQEERLLFLSHAIDHREPSVRRGGIEFLREEKSTEATQIILKVYERDIEVDEVRIATREALRVLRNFLPLDAIIHSSKTNDDKYARARSLKLLGVIGGDSARKALIESLGSNEVYLRGTAVMALGELGNPRAISDLEKLLANANNQRIALQIKTAIKHLRRQNAGSN